MEDRWWTGTPAPAALLRARPGRRPLRRRLPRSRARALVLAERMRLRCGLRRAPLHSTFSFLDGASHPVELAAAAARAGPRGARAHRSRRAARRDGARAGMQGARRAADHGRRAHARRRLAPHAAVREPGTGYRNLCLLLTLAHAGTREWSASGTARRVAEPSVPLEDVERHAEGLVCLSGCAREGAVGGRVDAASRRAAAAVARRLLRAFGRGALPGRAPAAVRAPRPPPQPPARAARRAARRARAWPPATCTRTIARARVRSRTRSWRCGSARRSTSRSRGGAATRRTCSRRRRRWRRASPTTLTRSRSRAASPSGSVRPHERPRLPLPGRRGRDGRPPARRDLPRACSTTATRPRRAAPRRRRGSRRSSR